MRLCAEIFAGLSPGPFAAEPHVARRRSSRGSGRACTSRGINPLPEFQWALADTLRAAGRADEAATVEAKLKQTGAQTDPRTFALFLATRGEQTELAVQLAQRELKDRADIFTHDALAWALGSAGRLGEAWPHMEKALAEGTRTPGSSCMQACLQQSRRTAEAESWLNKARSSPAHVAPLGGTATRRDPGRPCGSGRRSITSAGSTIRFPGEDHLAKASLANKNKRRERQMKINLITLTAVVALALAPPRAAQASSHMDAPLITLDPSANTTDVYAFVDQDNGSAPASASSELRSASRNPLSSRSASIRTRNRASGRTYTISTTTCSTKSTSPPAVTWRRGELR